MKEWIERVLQPILNNQAPDPAEVERLGGLALFSADADKIKEYVFESAKLPDIRGASMILDELNRGQPDPDGKNLLGVLAGHKLPVEGALNCVIYAGGGSLLALVPSELAATLQQEMETLYPRETGTATITCVWRRVTPAELTAGLAGYSPDRLTALQKQLAPEAWRRIAAYYQEGENEGPAITAEQLGTRKNFGELVTLLGIMLRRAKESKAYAPFIEAVPYGRRCEACGQRPATTLETSPDERYLCKPCKWKAERSRDGGAKRSGPAALNDSWPASPRQGGRIGMIQFRTMWWGPTI